MKKDDTKANAIYTENFNDIVTEGTEGWGYHILCISGYGNFEYNGKQFSFKENDAMVISHPELVKNITISEDCKVKIIAAPFKFMYNLLPANHYGVAGCINLFENPLIPLTEDDTRLLDNDIEQIRSRIDGKEHLFYEELMGSVFLTMIYDLFNFHAKIHEGTSSSERSGNVVRRLVTMLEGGRSKHNREVAYYASQLNVTPKYLSDTVKRITGRSVMYLIDQYTVPMVAEYLKNSDLSLKQIADEMNFKTLSYFCRYVQKHLGMTPSEYRSTYSPLKKKFQTP